MAAKTTKAKAVKEVKNLDVKQPESANVRRVIKTEVQIYRVRQNILNWRNATLIAENIRYPQRYDIYQIYSDIVLDSHLSAAIQQRKNLTLSKEFQVIGPDGEVNEEKTNLIKKKWFLDYVDLALDSMFWGHSLIQFDSIVDDEFKCVELVPRIYVKPEFHIVTQNYSDLTGTDYLDLPFKNWCIGVGKPRDLGLLLKAAPLIIWKKNALGSWSEYIEIFGSPIRIGKTNVRDEASRINMENMLKNMGTAAYGVFDIDDLIELVSSDKKDAFNVFDMMIQRCNSEISKLILGQTATMDEKAFVGSAEVQERILEQVADADEKFIRGVNNYQLIPMLNALGLGFDGCTITVKTGEEFDLLQKSTFDLGLLNSGKYTFSPQYLLDNYGSEVIEVEEPTADAEGNSEDVVKKIKNLYK